MTSKLLRSFDVGGNQIQSCAFMKGTSDRTAAGHTTVCAVSVHSSHVRWPDVVCKKRHQCNDKGLSRLEGACGFGLVQSRVIPYVGPCACVSGLLT